MRLKRLGAYLGCRTTLHLRFDLPGKVWPAIFLKDKVVAFGVDVLSVKNKAVHVEEAGAYFWESEERQLVTSSTMGSEKMYSGFAIIMVAVLVLKRKRFLAVDEVIDCVKVSVCHGCAIV